MALLVVLLLAYVFIPFASWQVKLLIAVIAVVGYVIGSIAVGVIDGISNIIHWIFHRD